MNVLSLGSGVQSSTLLLMAAHGEIKPKPDVAIFSDTGWEPKKVYDHFKWLKKEAERYGIKVVITDNGNIKDDIVRSVETGDRFASVPFFIKNEDGTKGMARRQCTREYKIAPIQKKIRELLGYQPRQRIKEDVKLWMGISNDEIMRAKPSRVKWIEHRFPLLENDIGRGWCLEWMQKKGYPLPPKSACIGCPFHDDRMWLDMKRNDPESWNEAVEIDTMIKRLPRFEGQAFLHRSCIPLDEVDLKENQMELDLFDNECEGMCGL
jgi:hypothetical protein